MCKRFFFGWTSKQLNARRKQIPRPPGLESLAATRFVQATRSAGVGLHNNHTLLARLQEALYVLLKDHAKVATSCAPNTSKLDGAARIGLRVGYRGCRQRWKLRPRRWNLSGCYFADLFAGGREVARAAQTQGFRAQAWDTIFDAQRLNQSRSAVRSRLKRDIKLGQVLAVCLAPPSGATLMRAQRVALSLFAFCSKHGVPTALDQPCASLLWQAATCRPFLQSQRYCDVRLDLCQFGRTYRRPTGILLADVDPCDTQSSATRAQAPLTAKQVDCQLNFVTHWYKR